MGNAESENANDPKKNLQRIIFGAIEKQEFPPESSLVEFFNLYDTTGHSFIPNYKLKTLVSDICSLIISNRKNSLYKSVIFSLNCPSNKINN